MSSWRNPPFSGMPAKLEKFANEDKQFYQIVDASRGLMTVKAVCILAWTARERLRVVRLASEIRVQDLLAVGFVVVLVG